MTDTTSAAGPIAFHDKLNELLSQIGSGYQISKFASDQFYSKFFQEKHEPSEDLVPKPKESIIAAAVQWEGVTFSLPKPARHGQVLHSIEGTILKSELVPYVCQGFLTSEGRFVNRVQARHIAYMAGQNPKTTGTTRDLYSEDLW